MSRNALLGLFVTFMVCVSTATAFALQTQP
jgi:hypothetical protein